MAGINKVILLGRLGKDPEIKTLRDGRQFASLRMATSKRIKEDERTTWHSITVWSETTTQYLSSYACKGTQVYIEGEIETRTYEKDGQTHYATEIVVGQYGGNVQIVSDGVGRGANAGDEAPTTTRTRTKPDYKTASGRSDRPSVNAPLEPLDDYSDLNDSIPF